MLVKQLVYILSQHLNILYRLHKEIAKSDFKYNVKLNNWLITMYSR